MKKIAFIATILSFLLACNNTVEQKIVQTDLEVKGMTCTGCENAIETNVAKLDGVVEVKASHTEGTATVKYDQNQADIEEIKNAIEAKGYKVTGFKQADVTEN